MAKFAGGFPNKNLLFNDVKNHPRFSIPEAMVLNTPRWEPFVHGFSLGFIRPDQWHAINDWIREDAVPGRFVVGTSGYTMNWVEAVYGFDSANAAMMFRMRWS